MEDSPTTEANTLPVTVPANQPAWITSIQQKVKKYLHHICLTLIVMTIFIFCLVVGIPQTKKPTFALDSAAIQTFTVSGNNTISIAMHATIWSCAPSHVSIFYKDMEAHARYNGTAITASIPVPMTGPGTVSVTLSGTNMALSPALVAMLQDELKSGGAEINISLSGSIHKKGVPWPTNDDLIVDCFGLFKRNVGTNAAAEPQKCTVS
ncbi:hypothetical protein Droror1_Dr00003869 [Drosera rotundifolia]